MRVVVLALCALLAGCADPDKAIVQPVSIKASNFCEIMCRTLPANATRQPCKPRWDVTDRRETITDARRVGAAYDKICRKPPVRAE